METQSSRVFQVALILVNYRTPDIVIDCLGTLLPEISNLDAKVIVVDNDSRDDSIFRIDAWLKNRDRGNHVLLVQSEQNGGFASGNNLGIKSLDAEFYVLLNSDTLVRPGAIHKLIDTVVNAESYIGLVGPGLEWADERPQESCFRFHSPVSEFCNAAQTGIIDKLLNKSVVAIPVGSSSKEPEWVSFACVLVKREVIQQAGLLDERFFMYFEDVEFCHRARQFGWRIVYAPEARVVHLRGVSSTVEIDVARKKRLPRYYYESRTRYFYLTYGWIGLTGANLLWEAGRLISKTRQLLGRPDKSTIQNQWLDIWTNWLNPGARYTHPEAGKADLS